MVELTLDALWFLSGALGLSLDVLWDPFNHLGVPLGRLWAPFDSLGVPLGSLCPSFWAPLAVLGHLWVVGNLLEFVHNWTSFPSIGSDIIAPAHKK